MQDKYWKIAKNVVFIFLVVASIIYALTGDYPRASYNLLVAILMEITNARD